MWWRKKDEAELDEQESASEKEAEIEIWIEALREKNSDVRKEAADVLGRIGDDRAVEPLIQTLRDEERAVRRSAAEALGKIGDTRAVEPLIRAIGNWAIRRNAIKALGKIGDTRAIDPLIEVLEDENVKTRATVAEALGEIGDARAIIPLIKALGDKLPAVRNCAEKAIEKMSHAQSVNPLIEALGEKNSNVRKEAAKILGKIGDARAVEPLIERLEDYDRGVRENVIEALGKIGDVRAIEPLILVLGVWDNQWTAAKALDNLDWKPEQDREKTYYFLAKKQIDPLVALGTPAITLLEEVLKRSDLPTFAKEGAIEALEKIYAAIDTVIFGHGKFKSLNPCTTLFEADITELSMSMSQLKKIIVSTETYNFHQVERFITYAVNYIGQEYLKNNVEVHIYDDPSKLHPNLRNSLENLCKCVEVNVYQ